MPPLYQHTPANAAGADAAAANRPSSSRTCASTPFATGGANAQQQQSHCAASSSPCTNNNNSAAPQNFNLATLAEVASSMTPEAPIRPSAKSPTFIIDAGCSDSNKTGCNKQLSNEAKLSGGGRKRHRNSTTKVV